MYRLFLAAALAASIAAPALAQSELSLNDISQLYCEALVSGDMSTVQPILTPDLTSTMEGRTGIVWQGYPGTVTACRMVGASGSFDHPEAVLFYLLADGTSGSDRLVLSFIDEQIRINDVAFADGGSLRQSLAAQ